MFSETAKNIISSTANAGEQEYCAASCDSSGNYLHENSPHDVSISKLGDKTCTYTFRYRGDDRTRSVCIELPPFSRIEPNRFIMQRVAGTELWEAEIELPLAARFSYRFVENGLSERETEPNNFTDSKENRSYMDRVREMSLPLETPGVAPRFEPSLPPGSPRGQINEYVIHDSITDQDRLIWCYTPPVKEGFSIRNLMIFFDGEMYKDVFGMPEMFDSLYHLGTIPATAAIFISNKPDQREAELLLDPGFARFTAKQLIDLAKTELGIIGETASVSLSGASFGGIAALYTAAKYPGVFSGVIAQSPSLWKCQNSINELTGKDSSHQIDLHWGKYELQERNGIAPAEAIRGFAVKLNALGRQFVTREYRGGHGPLSWREEMPDALKRILNK